MINGAEVYIYVCVWIFYTDIYFQIRLGGVVACSELIVSSYDSEKQLLQLPFHFYSTSMYR